MKQIVLASQSPRRRELLGRMGVAFDVEPSEFDEYLDDDQPVETIAEELALGKALDVAKRHPDAIVIGSDVIVSVGGRQLAKAASEEEARAMLRLVASHPNKVTCAVAVVDLQGHVQKVAHETTWVYFRPYDEAQIERYIQTGDWKDKAGAYGIQSGAASLVERVEGNIDVVIGLPTHTLTLMLTALGVPAKSVDVRFADFLR